MGYTFNELRERYGEFVYRDFIINESENLLQITYDFEITGLSEFHPTWEMPKKKGTAFKDNAAFRELVFYLGMTELVSYWKISCPKVVRVLCGKLGKSETAFFKKTYFSGLGEFFYRNNITTDIESFMNIISGGEPFSKDAAPVSDSLRTLVPVGGGKDSIVSLKTLEENKDNTSCFMINPRGATLMSAYTAGYSDEDIIAFKRTLDKNMLELNKQGYLNGHTPFSAIVAFSAVIAAFINDIKYVSLSNEASANESTVMGSDVNHQYSKSFEFERDFHEFINNSTSCGVYYFSLLRPMSELQIAGCFAKYPQFFKVFKSCNVGSKEDRWCGDCAKCLFVSIILCPFLTQEELTGIFNKNMLDMSTLEGTFSQLIGLLEEKPFECVGSVKEVNFALCMGIKNLENRHETLPFLLNKYKNSALFKNYSSLKNPYENFFDKNNLLPDYFKKLLVKNCYGGREEFLC